MRAPEFWNHKEGRDAAPMLRTLLSPLGWLYGRATAKRRWMAIVYVLLIFFAFPAILILVF